MCIYTKLDPPREQPSLPLRRGFRKHPADQPSIRPGRDGFVHCEKYVLQKHSAARL